MSDVAAPCAPAPCAAAPAASPGGMDNFSFEHPALRLEGAFFTLQVGSMEPIMRVRLGGASGTVPLRQVAATFDIKPDSPDGLLLRKVEVALRHVPSIRHGDRIPTEVVTGQASWAIDDRHKELAALRVVGTLFRSIGRADLGSVEGSSDTAEAVRKQVRDVAEEIARQVGIDLSRKQEVVDRADLLVAEMAFIEALRAYYKPVFDMSRKLREIAKAHARDRGFADQMASAQNLLKTPAKKLQKVLDDADALVADPVKALREVEATVKKLRRLRDALHFETLRWGELPARWASLRTGTDAAAGEALLLARFLSTNFYSVKSWAGSG